MRGEDQQLEQRIDELIEEVEREEEKVSRYLEEELVDQLVQDVERDMETVREGRFLDMDIGRRQLLKLLGLATGSLALSASASAKWALWQPASQGTSDIDCDTLDGQNASDFSGTTSVDRASDSTASGDLAATGGNLTVAGTSITLT